MIKGQYSHSYRWGEIKGILFPLILLQSQGKQNRLFSPVLSLWSCQAFCHESQCMPSLQENLYECLSILRWLTQDMVKMFAKPPGRNTNPSGKIDARAVMHVGIANQQFPLESLAGKTFPAFPAHVQSAILRIWQEAHCICTTTTSGQGKSCNIFYGMLSR